MGIHIAWPPWWCWGWCMWWLPSPWQCWGRAVSGPGTSGDLRAVASDGLGPYRRTSVQLWEKLVNVHILFYLKLSLNSCSNKTLFSKMGEIRTLDILVVTVFTDKIDTVIRLVGLSIHYFMDQSWQCSEVKQGMSVLCSACLAPSWTVQWSLSWSPAFTKSSLGPSMTATVSVTVSSTSNCVTGSVLAWHQVAPSRGRDITFGALERIAVYFFFMA